MSKVKSITEYKLEKVKNVQYKKYKKIQEELDAAKKVMDLAINGLTYFGHYITVMETVSCLQTNKTLVEIQLAKVDKFIKDFEDESKLEETTETNT